MDSLDFIYKRHSVRKFRETDVPRGDIEKIINAAAQAPSGKNRQNWHFIAVKNREVIDQMAEAIEVKGKQLVEGLENEEVKEQFLKYLPFYGFFTRAPVTVLVFAGPMKPRESIFSKRKMHPKRRLKNWNEPSPGFRMLRRPWKIFCWRRPTSATEPAG